MSDHFSGPRAIAGPAADICDLFVFPSPATPGALVLVMTVRPEARLRARFSDAVTYSFRLRPAVLPRSGTHIDVADETAELTIDLTFDAGDGAGQKGRCVTSGGGSVAFGVGEAENFESGVRVYAGVRSDPFFIDLPAFERTLNDGRLRFAARGRNSLRGANVLAIVVELDGARIPVGEHGPVWAVAAETRVTGKVPIRIERVGRPEVKNFLLRPSDPLCGDLELRDIYNLEDPYHLSGAYRAAYRSRINANLTRLDSFDGTVDWVLDGDTVHPLTEIFLYDRLILDLSRPIAASSYFEIERALVVGREHATFGGRAPNDDVMDTFLTLLVGGADGRHLSDGVSSATKAAGLAFPYLASPNHGPWPVIGRRGAALKHHSTHQHTSLQ